MLQVLWFGVGKFGGQMALRLLESGCRVYVPILDHGRIESERLVDEGGEWYAGAEVDAYCFCLPRSEDVEQCINQFTPSTSIQMLDFSTGDPRQVEKLANRASISESAYYDCPVSGSATQALSGALTMWIGSIEASATQTCREIVNKLAARQFWMGARGAGFSAKLVNQVVHILNVAAIGEGLRLADAQGLSREIIIESLKSSSAASVMLDRFGDSIAANDHTPHFRLELAAKDIDYAISILPPSIRSGLPYLDCLKQDLDDAIARGLQDENFTCFIEGN